MAKLKHLPVADWPDADRAAFAAAYVEGDIFDETTGPGAHLAAGSRLIIETAYRRWLGFLRQSFPEDLDLAPQDRLTKERIRAFVACLEQEVRPTTVAHIVTTLFYAARFIETKTDWAWLRAIGSRLAARTTPLNRFHHLVPGARTLDFGLELMDSALKLRTGMKRNRQYRDGLIIALLSLWPIRRRSLLALTVDRHLVFDDGGVSVSLDAQDTKEQRSERCRVVPELLPYIERYLEEIRPKFLGATSHSSLWPSSKGGALKGDAMYRMVRARILTQYGVDTCLHDFRRAAATFTAIDAPENLGLIPGVLQHASPEVSEQHYNLANSAKASGRYNQTIADLKAALASRTRGLKR